MNGTKLVYDEIETPIGPLLIIANQKKLVRIDFGRMVDLSEKVTKWGLRYFEKPIFIHKPKQMSQVKNELLDYFANNRQDFTFAYEFHGTAFQKQVWQALFIIPYGETKTYKEIAIAIDNPKAVRAVGGAVNKNPFSIVAPCHRVIGANGQMVGYGGGLDKKEFLLKLEGK